MPFGIEPFSSLVVQVAPKLATFIIPEFEELLLDEEFPDIELLDGEELLAAALFVLEPAEGVGLAVAEGVGLAVAEGALETTFTPLDQTNLVPDLIQV